MFRKRRRTTVTCNQVLKGNCSKWYKDTRPILHNSHVGDLQWFSINEFRIEEDDRLITQYERSCSRWLKLCLFFNYHLKWANLSRISLIFIFTQKAKWSSCIHFLETIIMIASHDQSNSISSQMLRLSLSLLSLSGSCYYVYP